MTLDSHDLQSVLGFVAAACHVGFALLVWRRRGKSPIAPVLSLLFLDLAAWNFAAAAGRLSAYGVWHRVDHAFASLTPALVLSVVVEFVGKRRRLSWVVVVVFVAAGTLVLLAAHPRWGEGLLVFAVAVALASAALLLRHLLATDQAEERARARGILIALGVGTALGATELGVSSFLPSVPRLGSAGTLLAMLLLTRAALRARLLGTEISARAALYTFACGFASIAAYVAVVHSAAPATGLWITLASAALVVLGVTIAELSQRAALRRARTRHHVALGRLAEQLAHDLRNPLAALKGGLQFLAAEREAGRSIDDRTDYLDLIVEQVQRLERAVDHYQRLSSVAPVFERGSLNDVVRRVTSLQKLAAPPGVELRAALAEHLPDCRLDRDLLEAALDNTLRNAFEAMPGGGVVTVRTSRASDARVTLSIEDQGMGMDARSLERATDEFYTTKAHGTGLGLHFVKRVVEAHGGELTITSRLGKGTLLSASLPVSS
ncbi:MAG TPA: ATP-binding protein [Polyangiaceae bacterium]